MSVISLALVLRPYLYEKVPPYCPPKIRTSIFRAFDPIRLQPIKSEIRTYTKPYLYVENARILLVEIMILADNHARSNTGGLQYCIVIIVSRLLIGDELLNRWLMRHGAER
jgi:hypothetical protein